MTNLPCTRACLATVVGGCRIPAFLGREPRPPPPRSGNSVNLRWLLLNADKSLGLLGISYAIPPFRRDWLKRLLAPCRFIPRCFRPVVWKCFTTSSHRRGVLLILGVRIVKGRSRRTRGDSFALLEREKLNILERDEPLDALTKIYNSRWTCTHPLKSCFNR